MVIAARMESVGLTTAAADVPHRTRLAQLIVIIDVHLFNEGSVVFALHDFRDRVAENVPHLEFVVMKQMTGVNIPIVIYADIAAAGKTSRSFRFFEMSFEFSLAIGVDEGLLEFEKFRRRYEIIGRHGAPLAIGAAHRKHRRIAELDLSRQPFLEQSGRLHVASRHSHFDIGNHPAVEEPTDIRQDLFKMSPAPS